jgi:hypothetical protein
MATEGLPDLAVFHLMLERYFVQPVSDTRVQQLHAQLAAVFADPARLGGIVSAFHPSNGGRGFGLAWREELAYGHATPSPIEVAAWFAWSRGVPARAYCPEPLIGRWQQVDPTSSSGQVLWEFSAGGGFHTDDPKFAERTCWCVHRQNEHGPVDDAIWLDDALKISHSTMRVRELGAEQLRFDAIGAPSTAYRLRRL